MATYYVELNGGDIAPKTELVGGVITPSVSFSGAQIYPTSGGGGSATLQTKSVTYTPSTSQQTEQVTPDAGYDGLDKVNVTVDAVASGSVAVNNKQVTFTSPFSFNAATGKITSSNLYQNSITATVTPGYVDSATDGELTVYLNKTQQLDTVGATTYTPSTIDQTIPAQKYLTGAQTFKGVTYSGLDAGNIKKDVVVKIGDSADDDRIVSVTGTYEGGGGGTWDIEWDYQDGNPTSNGFSLTTGSGGGSATMTSDYYSMTSGTSGGTYLVHSPNFTAAAGIMEFELYFPSLPAGYNGCILSGPTFRYFVVGSNIKFYTTASTSVQVYSGIQSGQWYKFKIEYSASEGANMWVNGVLIHTYTSALGYDGTRFMLNMGGGSGTVYVRRLAMVDANSISSQEAFSIIFGG